ncbi:hypothetical protein NC653_035796 [Populus alba x Populus x berolinensis]|uniref:Uncharacterized protein n=1 Tax=Populus alba x Populus x berolinensis TaxID=444605 RepID=A0AAD6LKX9_9ROSI|nr:hypothetical protein NC653_035796 [Populus alba x Populus x berolinensis]
MSGGTRNLLIIVGVNTTAISWTVKKSYFADASTIATFVNNWAAMACGSNNIIDEVIFDCSTLFPLQDLPCFSSSNFMKEDVLSEILMKSSYLGAMTAVTGEIEATKINAATIAVHVRRRMKPPVPQQSIGNFYLVATAN